MVSAVRQCAIGASWDVEAEFGVGGGAEDVAECRAAFVTGPASLTAFEFADPAEVDVVSGQVPAGIGPTPLG